VVFGCDGEPSLDEPNTGQESILGPGVLPYYVTRPGNALDPDRYKVALEREERNHY
jgi:hypothetical protein